MRAYRRFLPLAILAALAMTGTSLANEAPTGNRLADTQWQLVLLGGEPVAGEVTTTLIIGGDGSIGGNGGCNSYGGSIEFSGEAEITIGNVFSTMMHCGDTPMAQEHGYFDALAAAAAFTLDGDRLVLSDASGNAVATLAPSAAGTAEGTDQPDLGGTQWRATSLAGAPVAEGVESTLIFRHDGSAGGHSGCNGYGGQVSASPDGTIAFTGVVTTQIGCMDPAGSQERALYQALEEAAAYTADAGTLTLRDEAGRVLAQFTAVSE